ncbi:LiaF domain-containing protein, partial [Streptomyces sp. URMC 126]|uniref:LiaF domain-containing protein n=1 Tax=Streptomyces sp. URMC 126 TaxID=3423401 RepID=UPI003F1D2369
ADPYAPTAPAENLIAVFGGAARRGRWRVGGRLNAFALFGGVEIDLTEAFFEQRTVVVSSWALFGGVEIKVPENVSLRCTGTGVFGGFDVDGHESPDEGAPEVVVTGWALFGGVTAKARAGKRVKDLRAAG